MFTYVAQGLAVQVPAGRPLPSAARHKSLHKARANLALLKPFPWKLPVGEELRGQHLIMVSKAKQAIALPAIIDLDSLDGIRDGLIDAIEEGPVRVDASAVERVSTNALIMLISAAETARKNQFDFAIDQPSATMLTAIERLGLGAQFSGMMRG
jgi:anti-anti-sigma regulatory factor